MYELIKCFFNKVNNLNESTKEWMGECLDTIKLIPTCWLVRREIKKKKLFFFL